MNRSSLRWLSGAAIVGVTATALVAPAVQAAAASASFCSDGSQPMVTQDEVTENFDEDVTTVKGLTVVKGTTPVEFTGTYTGHLEDALGKGVDMLLFELSGAGIDSGVKPAGIWAGMSGSPVYTEDGRLIGAVAYGLSPDNIPIAGVTPADYMKKVGSDRLAGPKKLAITRKNLKGVSAAAAADLVGHQIPHLSAVKVITGGAGANALANRTQARVPKSSAAAKSVRAGGFAAVGAPTRIAEPLVPGGNIAVGYSTGDLFSGGVGTVTAICGSTVWAFGHPMDFQGDTALSMHNASAALIVRDATGWSGSYKQVSRIGQQVGTITKDGYGAIRGELGLFSGFPVTTTVKNASGRVLDTYRGTVVDPWMATNASMAPAIAVFDVLDNFGIGSAKHSWRIDYRLRSGKKGTLANSQVYASFGWLADDVATDLGNDIAAIAFTDLADATITSVTSTLTLMDDKAVDHRFAGAQLKKGKKWVKLRGRTLTAKKSYVVRPVIRRYVNGKPTETSTGPRTKFRLGAKAQNKGNVTYGPRGESGDEDCMEFDGEIICFEFDGEESESDSEPKTFAALLEQLDALIPANRAQAQVEWKWKAGRAKGTKQKKSRFVAPGVITGSYKATFRIRP